jgi:hypothetical protein
MRDIVSRSTFSCDHAAGTSDAISTKENVEAKTVRENFCMSCAPL